MMDMSAPIMSTTVKRSICQNEKSFKHECTSGWRKLFKRKNHYTSVRLLYGGMMNLSSMPMTIGRIIEYIKMLKPNSTQSLKVHYLWLQTMCRQTLDGFALQMGDKSACYIMHCGKNKNGYITLKDVENQAQLAMDICLNCWPKFNHVFMYDNATTHFKWPDGSLFAQKMPKYSSKPRKLNWLVEAIKQNEQTNWPVHNEDETLMKVKIKMTNANFNGQP